MEKGGFLTMIKELICTGKMISGYLVANGLTISDLAQASGVSLRNIYRFINDDAEMSPKIAIGINKLMPEISLDFLASYETKYRIYKEKFQKDLEIPDIDACISRFSLKSLYKSHSNKRTQLVDIGRQVFGLSSLQSMEPIAKDIKLCFSKAKNSHDETSFIWLVASYSECCLKYSNNMPIFNRDEFDSIFINLKTYSGTTGIESTIYAMESICEKCGIAFHYRPSIPNARIKGVTIKDCNDHIVIVMSDLFKCVENLWLAFIHEMIHINNNDFDNNEFFDKKKEQENEKFINDESIKFFIGNSEIPSSEIKNNDIGLLANKCDTPIGIMAEIIRYKQNAYTNPIYNSFIHYYQSPEYDYSFILNDC